MSILSVYHEAIIHIKTVPWYYYCDWNASTKKVKRRFK